MSLTTRMLAALVLGIAAGAGVAALNVSWRDGLVNASGAIGGVWLDGLRMTIVPLVFSLLVTAVAQAAGVLQAGRDAGRTLGLFAALLVASGLIAAVVAPLILQAWPAPAFPAQWDPKLGIHVT